jgi:predicted TPR repeat methyltransferase
VGKRSKKRGKQTRKISVEDAIAMAVQLHQRGMIEEAESVYNDVLSVVPDQADAIHYLGVIAHQMGDSPKGVSLIKKSLAVNPKQPDALNNLGNIYRELGRLDEAKNAYNKVLELAPGHADAWVNVGVILRQLSNPEDALEKLERAIELNPKHGDAYHNLGNTLADLKRFEEALDAYEMATKLSPEGGMAPKSIARVQYDLGRKDDAIRTLQRWSYTNPEDAAARHLLAAFTGKDVPKQASENFVRQSFDSFSKSFDEVLTGLNYKAPKYVGELVIDKLAESVEGYRILDIGCGTGLCGPLIKPLASTLVGVDLSPGMLIKAKERGVYDALEETELTQYMLKNGESFDVVTCVDTLCYIGDLSSAIPAAYSALDKQGWFFFTVEQHMTSDHEQGYWLQPHGRYSHKKAYLASLLEGAGFAVDTMDDVILRREGPNDVSGLLVAARKIDALE